MDIREKLVALIDESSACFTCFPCGDYDKEEKYKIADHLLANGVTVQEQGVWSENHHISYDSIWGEDVHWYTYTCSVCGGEAMNNYDHCPFCGNPMVNMVAKGA